ncbi:MAG TPA: hypothetical protein VER12_02825 [Polyangiaceae bacterium]|nr:hypothetical protein [Polyangiaceae bacterium]
MSNNTDEVTQRINELRPSPNAADEPQAPAPEGLERAWIEQATESKRNIGFADTIPDLGALLNASDQLGALSALNSVEDDDEITAEYVRHQRISKTG